MKSIQSEIKPTPTIVVATQSLPNITNISAIWRPSTAVPGNVKGTAGASIMLRGNFGGQLMVGILRHFDGAQELAFSWSSSDKKLMNDDSVSLPKGDHTYLEIDVNPRNGQVTFWINDKGLDVGVLPGFNGGAQQAGWRSLACPAAHLLSGTFTDCSIATSKGWQSADLRESNLTRHNLQTHHQVELLSPNSIGLSDQRSLV